jgi:palmitoyltransferase
LRDQDSNADLVWNANAVDYYMRPAYRAPESDVGIAFLVPFCILLFLAATAYLRLILVIFFDPGLVPLGPRAEEERSREQQGRAEHDLEGQRYSPGPVDNADSPGLEQFYHKDVFVCQDDGRPRWCSHCMAWKPDRAHHSSEMNRCVRKMDHFCPWVGGIISETCKHGPLAAIWALEADDR